MTVFWSRVQHHVTTSLIKLAVGERNVATNLGTILGCVIEYCLSMVRVRSRSLEMTPFDRSHTSS